MSDPTYTPPKVFPHVVHLRVGLPTHCLHTLVLRIHWLAT